MTDVHAHLEDGRETVNRLTEQGGHHGARTEAGIIALP